MNRLIPTIKSKELLFLFIIHFVAYVSFYFDRNDPGFKLADLCFFLNYALMAAVINWFLLPRFFYQKRYLAFGGFIALIMIGTILTEELILERIFYPESRGRSFQGVFYTLLDIIPPISILVGFKFAWDAYHKQLEVDTLRTYVQESELQYLKTQINPHFLFNNLNNLYSHAIEQSEKVPDIILELSAILRYMLYECKSDFVPLEREVENLKSYVAISEMQIEDRGQVNLNIGSLPEGLRISPLILIVFVENAFKHSQSSMDSGIQIEINLQVENNNQLVFKCQNNYQGSTNVENLSKGIGLDNVQKRLDLLYPDRHDLSITDNQGTFLVELKMWLSSDR